MTHHVIHMFTVPVQTFLISVIMAVACCLPRLVKNIDRYSRGLILVGTGGLVSLLVYDLIPDVWEIGGYVSLAIILLAWGAFTLAHSKFHDHHSEHHDDHAHCDDLEKSSAKSVKFLIISMTLHCVTSGVLLAMAQELSAKIALSVFFAMIGHKGYEALSVSLVLNQRLKSRKSFAMFAAIYALSFPTGVVLTVAAMRLFGGQLGPVVLKEFAMVAASVAIGSLIGCLIHDFIVPAYHRVKARNSEAGWVVAGILLTLLFIT